MLNFIIILYICWCLFHWALLTIYYYRNPKFLQWSANFSQDKWGNVSGSIGFNKFTYLVTGLFLPILGTILWFGYDSDEYKKWKKSSVN